MNVRQRLAGGNRGPWGGGQSGPYAGGLPPGPVLDIPLAGGLVAIRHHGTHSEVAPVVWHVNEGAYPVRPPSVYIPAGRLYGQVPGVMA